MKKLIIRLIALTVLISTIATMVPVSAATTNVNTATYLSSAAQMETYMENEIKKISGYVSGSMEIKSEKCYYKSVGYYTADELEKYYKKKTNVTYKMNNICVEVAITNIVHGLRRNNMIDNKVTDKEIFCQVFDYALQKNYYNFETGTQGNKVKEIFNRTLEFFALEGGKTRIISSCTKKSGCYSFLKNESVKNEGISFPVLYSMEVDGQTLAHTMAVSGCIKYTVTYQVKKLKTKTYQKEYVFFVASDGTKNFSKYLSPYIVNNKSVDAYSVSYK